MAKQLLHESSSKVISNLPRLVKRNKSDNRTKLIVDDIMELIARIDEEQSWDKLPCFVAKCISKIPTIPIEDIETYIIAQKLEKLVSRMLKLEVSNSLGVSNNVVRMDQDITTRPGELAGSSVNDTTVKAVVKAGEDRVGSEKNVTEDTSWSTVARRGRLKTDKAPLKVIGCNKTNT